MKTWTLVFLIGAAVDLVVAGLLLYLPKPCAPVGRPTPSLGIARFGAAALSLGALFVVKVLILKPYGLDNFGILHILWLDIFVVAPILGLLGLVFHVFPKKSAFARRLPWSLLPIAVLCAALGPVGIWMHSIEPFRLVVEESTVPLPAERSGSSEVRIAVLADIQTDRVSEYEHEAIDRALALKPDLILVPGDIFQGTEQELEDQLPALRSLLKKLQAPHGVWFVMGNNERGVHHVQRLLEGTGIQLLYDDIASIRVGDRNITLGGVELSPRGVDYRRTLAELESLPGDDDVRILIGHYPDAVLQLPENSRIDLVVAGHTHGGQVQLPGFGPPITLSRVPRDIAAGGLHEHHGNPIYVSRGIGCERGQSPRIRLFCKPEVSLLVLGGEPQS